MSEQMYLTSKELAQRWRLSEQTLANWRHGCKGPPFIRIGGSRVLYPVDGIHAYEKLDTQWLSTDSSQATSDATPS